MGHATKVVVALVIGGLCILALAAPAAAAGGDAEAAFLAMIGQERRAAGLPGYALAGDLVAVARNQAATMAAQDRLHHNPYLTVQVAGWQVVGENVGRGLTAADLHRAFMASDSHRREIMSPRFTEVGVGVVEGGGDLWVSQVFRLPAAPAPAATPAPEPPPAPRPPRPAPAPTTARPAATTTPATAATTAPPATAAPTAPPATAAPTATAPAVPAELSLAGGEAPGTGGRIRLASAATAGPAAAFPPSRRVGPPLVLLAAGLLLAVLAATLRVAPATRASRPAGGPPPPPPRG